MGGKYLLGRKKSLEWYQRCIVLVGKNIELDAICHQFEPYPYLQMCLHAGVAALAPLCMTWDAVEAVLNSCG